MSAPPSNRRRSTVPTLKPSPVDEVAREPTRVRTSPPLRERPWFRSLKRVCSVLVVVLFIAGSIVGGRAAHQWITHTPRFGAKDIEISGLVHTRRDEVLTAAHIDVGTNVLGLDTHAAERLIEQLPWVEHARVSRKLPGSIRIEIEERVVAAIVNAGGLYLAATDGSIFKRMSAGDPDDLPVVTGIQRQDFDHDEDVAREYVRDALALLADIAASSLANRARIEEVHRDPTGDLSMVLADSGTYVWLGRGPYRAKMSRLSAILDELVKQHLHAIEIHLESDRHPERAMIRLAVPKVEQAVATAPIVRAAPHVASHAPNANAHHVTPAPLSRAKPDGHH